MSNILRYDERCDVVYVCLTWATGMKRTKCLTRSWPKSTGGIDLILGGHTHTFMEKPGGLV